ncbi:MAG: hypothetical protein KDB00_28335, partial [Planctomycetales bacterium]|nr:hypothetical protein [Planctomycetales bacterium]
MILSKLKKLTRMPPSEIAGRMKGVAQVRMMQRKSIQGSSWASRFDVDCSGVIDRCVELVPGSRKDEIQQLRIEYPKYFEALRAETGRFAECIVAGEYLLLGKKVVVDPGLAWDTDPSTGYKWPNIFFCKVAYQKTPENVDFKNIWEIGRQQYVVELSRAWLLGGDTRYAELSRDMVLS